MQNFQRQGDVLILTDDLPPYKLGQEKQDATVAYGETTGHSHRFIEGRYKLYNLAEPVKISAATFFFLLKAETEVRLFHETHPDQILPIGDHLIGRQGEYDWASEVTREVED